MRTRFLIPFSLFLFMACQLNGAGKLPAASNAPAVAQSTSPLNANIPSLSSPAPGVTTETSPSRTFTDADFARHVEQLKAEIKKKAASPDSRAPAAQFSFVIQRPFVVIGDEAQAAVQEHADGTVKWAVSRLKQDFFPNDPTEILDIWLFKDAASYEKHARLLFGETPTTPYGYYSRAHKALIMNINTGGGTLVHEIVHPFMEANFPACPPWLNEGMGSLYEQCGDADGHIHGFTELAFARTAKGNKIERSAVIQGADGNGRERLLQCGQRRQLRAGALSLLLPAGTGLTGKVLS